MNIYLDDATLFEWDYWLCRKLGNGCLKYLTYLDDEKKKKKESSGRGEKWKALNDDIDKLKKKKRCLQKDVDAMTVSADEYAEKAEWFVSKTFI